MFSKILSMCIVANHMIVYWSVHVFQGHNILAIRITFHHHLWSPEVH